MNTLTVEQQQLVDDLAKEFMSGFIDIVMVSNICEPEHSNDGVKTTVLPRQIQYRLRAIREKLRRYLYAQCTVHQVFSKKELFTVNVHESDDLMSGCEAIIEEFNVCVSELYKQYREDLEPHYSKSEWCAFNVLKAFVE